MLMPFGKHKGKHVEDIPHDYLKWLAGNHKLSARLKDEVQRVLHGRPTTLNVEQTMHLLMEQMLSDMKTETPHTEV